MTVQFYSDITARLIAKLPWFTYCKLFNNQFESMEDQNEQTFPNLSIFIEYLKPVDIITGGSGVQWYDVTVRFHLYLITYLLEDLQILQYKTDLHKALQGHFPTNCSSLNRINEEPDQNRNSYIVWCMDYQTQIPSGETSSLQGKVDVAPVTLDLIGDLKIDNEIIRTGVL